MSYNLHVILRFELEQRIMAGLDLRELPQAWNEAMSHYLGVDVPDDAHGVLQDKHWSRGNFGYFPTYSLGNVISVQIWERMREDIADVDEQMGRGEFAALGEWLREHLYRHGRKFLPAETLERIHHEEAAQRERDLHPQHEGQRLDDGEAAVDPQRQELIVEPLPQEFVQCAERLIHQQQLGCDDQCPRDRRPHLHATGELTRKMPRNLGQADALER